MAEVARRWPNRVMRLWVRCKSQQQAWALALYRAVGLRRVRTLDGGTPHAQWEMEAHCAVVAMRCRNLLDGLHATQAWSRQWIGTTLHEERVEHAVGVERQAVDAVVAMHRAAGACSGDGRTASWPRREEVEAGTAVVLLGMCDGGLSSAAEAVVHEARARRGGRRGGGGSTQGGTTLATSHCEVRTAGASSSDATVAGETHAASEQRADGAATGARRAGSEGRVEAQGAAEGSGQEFSETEGSGSAAEEQEGGSHCGASDEADSVSDAEAVASGSEGVETSAEGSVASSEATERRARGRRGGGARVRATGGARGRGSGGRAHSCRPLLQSRPRTTSPRSPRPGPIARLARPPPEQWSPWAPCVRAPCGRAPWALWRAPPGPLRGTRALRACGMHRRLVR